MAACPPQNVQNRLLTGTKLGKITCHHLAQFHGKEVEGETDLPLGQTAPPGGD